MGKNLRCDIILTYIFIGKSQQHCKLRLESKILGGSIPEFYRCAITKIQFTLRTICQIYKWLVIVVKTEIEKLRS